MWLLCSLLLELFIFLVRGEKFFPAKEAASFMSKNKLSFFFFYRKVEKRVSFQFDFLTSK